MPRDAVQAGHPDSQTPTPDGGLDIFLFTTPVILRRRVGQVHETFSRLFWFTLINLFTMRKKTHAEIGKKNGMADVGFVLLYRLMYFYF